MAIGDIHGHGRRIEYNTQILEDSKEISEENKEVILGLKKFLEAEGQSEGRIARNIRVWNNIAAEIGWQIAEPDKDKLMDLVVDLNQNNFGDKDLAPATVGVYKQSIRKMYVHYMESENPDFDGEELCNFFTCTVEDTPVDPDQLPTPDTVRKLVRNATNFRDKALIVTLWASAGRIGEVLGLKWKDVVFEDDLVKLHFRDTKTGGSRKVPIRAGLLYLRELKERDEESNNREAFLFRSLNPYGDMKDTDYQISHPAARAAIKRAREGTGIPARIKTNPHAFRKGRATFLAAKGMNQAQLCRFGGWVQGSSSVSKYIRMADSDVEAGIRQLADLETGENLSDYEDINPWKCENCGKLNKFEKEDCGGCN